VPKLSFVSLSGPLLRERGITSFVRTSFKQGSRLTVPSAADELPYLLVSGWEMLPLFV
jgi:hypothetical protein